MNRLQAQSASLTRGQLQVADYLVREPQILAFSTGAEIGRVAGVSESTVIRLAYSLGYRSFVEMQDEARGALTDGSQRTRALLDRSALESPGGEGVMKRVMEHDTYLIRQTMSRNSPETFAKAVELMVGARHIFLAGARSSYAVTAFFAYTLRLLLGNATLLEADRPYFLPDVADLNSDTVLVAIAFPRYSETTLRLAAYAQRLSCPVIAITDSQVSPLGLKADLVLTTPVDSPAATHSYAGPLSLCTALLTAVTLQDRTGADKRLARIEEVYTDWGIVSPRP